MFDTLQEVADFYEMTGKENSNCSKRIYKEFEANVQYEIKCAFSNAEGFGEIPFCWNWWLLVKQMPDTFSFLEIGVYKGRVLALIQRFANMQNKRVRIVGVTPLSVIGDKYSTYEDIDYMKAIHSNYEILSANLDCTEIITGLSTSFLVKEMVLQKGPFDIVYIDGGHDYDTVCEDIGEYTKTTILKKGGYLVLDDASLLLPNSYGIFLGHEDVSIAIQDKIDKNTQSTLKHLYAIGHNRVWIQNVA